MAAIFPVLMMSGAALSAAGAIQQGNAAKASANYNAQLKERDAGLALQQANAQAAVVARQSALAQGSILAESGASGVSTNEDVLAMSASQAELDRQRVLYQGKLTSTGFLSDAALYKNQGINAQQQSQLSAAGYLIGGAGQASYAGARAGAGREDLTTANPPSEGYAPINWGKSGLYR